MSGFTAPGGDGSEIGDPLLIANGGTSATTAAAARTALGVPAIAHAHSADDVTSGTLPIARGGTNATSAGAALTSLGAAAASHSHSADDITSGTLPVGRGGTGGTTAAAARTALGAGTVTGTGTDNYLPRFDAAGTGLENSNIIDDGTKISFAIPLRFPTSTGGNNFANEIYNYNNDSLNLATSGMVTILCGSNSRSACFKETSSFFGNFGYTSAPSALPNDARVEVRDNAKAQLILSYSGTYKTTFNTDSAGNHTIASVGTIKLHGTNRATYDAAPSTTTIRDIMISHGLMAAS